MTTMRIKKALKSIRAALLIIKDSVWLLNFCQKWRNTPTKVRGVPSVNLLKLVPAIKVLFSNKVTHLSHLLTTVSGSSNVFIYFLKHRSEVTMKMIIVSESDNQMHLTDKIDCFTTFGICDDIDTLTFWLSRWWNAQIAPTTNTYNQKHVWS